jgi:hypothetical protein
MLVRYLNLAELNMECRMSSAECGMKKLLRDVRYLYILHSLFCTLRFTCTRR